MGGGGSGGNTSGRKKMAKESQSSIRMPFLP
ncbi:uncharacterized protein G2W53_024552 [Senna tora]|uniref:Uncharacterized protein n=1 Tax=Senna tora TaxID=362788 RepID=A0A834WDZ3_9FABA|nr:uncharacterized protein G2W53_024552 [Senna tora]